ncbi:ATP-binding protein [Phaeobacter sp. HF9A]|uniref:ATP-binding protein n=1 Tax=Phaeobacter sp. HF9A TaxID=2721561 RepID=UPI00142FD1E1|nr:ATP-binding protein [Phaeobacter sp. HF9A]NIZ14765.1 response regulator [Phaeobacter sp. HF9A]
MTLQPDSPLIVDECPEGAPCWELRAALAEERRLREEVQAALDRRSQSLQQANRSLVALARQVDRMVKERTEDLARDRATAEAESAAKTQFLATMSHEIRTPLNGVLGMAAALADTALNEEQVQILDVLRDSGRLLRSIVDDILDLSKIEDGKLELEYLPTDIKALSVAVFRQFEPRVLARGLSFQQSCDWDTRARASWLEIDPTRVQQVLSNLLSNAVKFTEQGMIELRTQVHLDEAAQEDTLRVVMQVRDTGVGLSAIEVERLFQPYMQADASVHRNHGGSGLGLSIARQICQSMGGDLTCQSVKGEGSTFTASFRARAAAPAQAEANVAPRGSDSILSDRRWRVLVAEDNRTNRMVLHHMLKDYDLDLIWVQNGEEAVDACHRMRPDLVLMDVNMPVLDGVTATARIRSREAEEGRVPVPVIAVSANALLHQVTSYLEQGMTEHVAKPIRKAHLLQVMARALMPET